MLATALDANHRRRSLERMAGELFDVVVIGGGITGAGTALDAASRGLSVALVEARDYAAGTSSKSSKLIHGGLRYLEMLDFKLVHEALRERELLLTRIAPHLVRPVPFLWPLRHRVWERLYVGAGLLLYDSIGGARSVPRARHLSKRRALRVAPALRADALVGAIQFYDAQEDDARMAMMVARTAAGHGAALATRVTATGFANEGGRIAGIRAFDRESGGEIDVRARHVISAAGVWTDEIRLLAGSRGGEHVRPSKGVHFLVPRDRIPMTTGVLTRTEKSVLFIIPWGEHWVIGDTDTDWRHGRGRPLATGADVAYLLARANEVLARPLRVTDIEGVFAGLRPLVAGAAGSDTAKLSRGHVIDTPAPGLTTIAGGKYTTYRVMAADVVDAAADAIGAPRRPSQTHEIALVGGDGYDERWQGRAGIARGAGLPAGQVERLLGRYGSCIDDLIAGGDGLAELDGGGGYLTAEIAYACSHEGALHLDDVLERRTRLAIESRDRGVEAAPAAAAIMASVLGWPAGRAEQEVERYRAGVAALLAAEAAPDDEAAVAAAARVLDGATAGVAP